MHKPIRAAGICAGVLALALVAPPAHAAEGTILSAGTADAIPNSYLVTLKDLSTASANSLAARFGGHVDRIFSTALNGFSVTMSERAARRLAAHPAVAAVEQDQVFRAATTQVNPPSWGLDRIDQRDLPLDGRYGYETSGRGVSVYVIDSGLRTSHSDFGGRARNGYDAIERDGVPQDDTGQGTFLAGVVAGRANGVAKDATVYGVRVVSGVIPGSVSTVIAGIEWVTANHRKPAVALIGLSGGPSTVLDTAVRNSFNAGITYVLPAGDGNANAAGFSPGRVPQALTVGASTHTDARAQFSNYGAVLDLFAPGAIITGPGYTDNSGSVTRSGTAAAAAHVAGVVARLLERDFIPPPLAHNTIVNAASVGKITNPGTGSPNRLLYWAPTA